MIEKSFLKIRCIDERLRPLDGAGFRRKKDSATEGAKLAPSLA